MTRKLISKTCNYVLHYISYYFFMISLLMIKLIFLIGQLTCSMNFYYLNFYFFIFKNHILCILYLIIYFIFCANCVALILSLWFLYCSHGITYLVIILIVIALSFIITSNLLNLYVLHCAYYGTYFAIAYNAFHRLYLKKLQENYCLERTK